MTSEQLQEGSKPPKQESTKIVGLISDTHIPTRAKNLPKEIVKIFENAEFIVHAGDLVDLSVIDELERIAPVLAVRGNMDSPQVRRDLPEISSFKLFNHNIGVTHDPAGFFRLGKLPEMARHHSFSVLVYGHTHSPSVKWEKGVLFINPGSPTNPIPPFVIRPSVALLKMTERRVAPEIVHIRA